MTRRLTELFLLLHGVAAVAACSLVDEDVRDCGKDYHLDYEMNLETSLTTEIRTELSLSSDVSVAQALETSLEDVFTEYAHDVDLSFYDVQGDSARLHHEAHLMDATQTSYTLYIPFRRYMHLATANLSENPTLALVGDEYCHTARIVQPEKDTLPSHKTGVFTARLPMDVKEGENQEFDVHLYMANCSASVVVDTTDSHIKDLKVFMSGFATGISLCDSAYRFDHESVIVADPIQLEEPGRLCFVSVNFPSRAGLDSTKAEETLSLWQIRVYATLQDGSVTETLMGINEPLLPGHVKVYQAKVQEDGSASPKDASVAVIVTLDWDQGLVQEIDF